MSDDTTYTHTDRANHPTSASTPLHILALSGGGFRGLYAASVLKHLEAASGAPIASRFDLICGTSAGGLLALGLAAGLPAAQLQAMFEEHGHRIFHKRTGARRLLGFWTKAKYTSDGLRNVLTEYFGERTLGDLKHRVLIPAVNYSKGTGQFFKTPHSSRFYMDHAHRLVDVGLATTAAPAYFPMHRIGEHGTFVDGGLVGNSPGFFGLHEAHHVLGAPRGPGNVRVLAIGTMSLGTTKSAISGLDWGILNWRHRLFDLVMSSQEYSTNVLLKHQLGEDYLQIDDPATPDQSVDIRKLDLVSAASIETLKSRGTNAAQAALGSPRMSKFLSHVAAAPTFFHGRNQNSMETLHA